MCLTSGMPIKVNWQDNATAKPWESASNALYTASKKVEDLGI